MCVQTLANIKYTNMMCIHGNIKQTHGNNIQNGCVQTHGK